MEIRITKYPAMDADHEKVKDFFSEANSNSLLNAVKHGAAVNSGQKFEIIVWTLHFCKHYEAGLFSDGRAKAERNVRSESKRYLKHIENLKSFLPYGITIRLEDKVSNTVEKLWLDIQVYASVSAGYSQKCYAAINESDIVHDWTIPRTLIESAKEFKDRILLSKCDLIHKICNRYDKTYPFNTIYYEDKFYQCLNYSYSSDMTTSYHAYGMQNLHGLEQCYGLAWAVAELSLPHKRCILRVVNDPIKRVRGVRLEIIYKETVTPKYTEW